MGGTPKLGAGTPKTWGGTLKPGTGVPANWGRGVVTTSRRCLSSEVHAEIRSSWTHSGGCLPAMQVPKPRFSTPPVRPNQHPQFRAAASIVMSKIFIQRGDPRLSVFLLFCRSNPFLPHHWHSAISCGLNMACPLALHVLGR